MMRLAVFRRFSAAIVLAVCLWPHTAAADDVAEDLLNAWIGAVVSADPTQVEAILAPEFQIVRGNGHRYDALAYVADGLPTIGGTPPEVAGIHVTEADGLMVVSYWLLIDIEDEGQTLTRRAPRLTVFRNINGTWRVSAHANFAVPQED